jgi:hypothetical protein
MSCSLGALFLSELVFTACGQDGIESLLEVTSQLKSLEELDELGGVILGAKEVGMKLDENDGGLCRKWIARRKPVESH